VYDVDTALDILMDRDGMDYEQAQEYFSFNVEGAWVGEGTPIWLHRIDGPELT